MGGPRSVRDLLHLLDEIKAAGARFRALDDPWCDTTTPQGELILTVMGGLAEFERKLIGQRAMRASSAPRPPGNALAGHFGSMWESANGLPSAMRRVRRCGRLLTP